MSRIYTHKDLVLIAYKWLMAAAHCGVAFREVKTVSTCEIADAIGFQSSGVSFLVECKISRSDFLGDRKKYFRQYPELGMGTYRYYLCPKGMIQVKDLPKGWGLIWVDDEGKAKKIYYPIVELSNASGNTYRALYKHDKNLKGEHGLMYSALRRLQIRNLVDQIYEQQEAQVSEGNL